MESSAAASAAAAAAQYRCLAAGRTTRWGPAVMIIREVLSNLREFRQIWRNSTGNIVPKNSFSMTLWLQKCIWCGLSELLLLPCGNIKYAWHGSNDMQRRSTYCTSALLTDKAGNRSMKYILTDFTGERGPQNSFWRPFMPHKLLCGLQLHKRNCYLLETPRLYVRQISINKIVACAAAITATAAKTTVTAVAATTTVADTA